MTDSHFDELAQQWWQTKGPMRTLHDINPARIEFVSQYIPSQSKHILDVGCGAGILTESLYDTFPNSRITAIDTSKTCIKVAKTHQAEKKIKYHHQTTQQHLKHHQNQYDAVVCLEVLEHTQEPEQILKEIQQLLKPNGICILSTLDRNLSSYLFAIQAAEHILGLIPKGTHRHDWFIRPSELDRCMRQLNFKILDIKGIHYNPFTYTAKLSDSIWINYISAYQLKPDLSSS